MFYSPFLEVLAKFEKQFADFVVYLIIYLVTFMVDTFAVTKFDRNLPLLSLFTLLVCYISARLTIKKIGKSHLFGTFVNWSLQYCVFLAVFSWFCYTLFIRHRYGL